CKTYRRSTISCRSGKLKSSIAWSEPWPPIVGHVRHLLNSEQKAADFRPPIARSDAAPSISGALRTPAPRSAPTSAANMPGEHLHKFKYSLSGGLQALCDLTHGVHGLSENRSGTPPVPC
uniref:Integron gene cassette protein n=1 Tax=Macrostomum lignano TaxID=282301 RepID=A0A1I8FCM9_9PLAT